MPRTMPDRPVEVEDHRVDRTVESRPGAVNKVDHLPRGRFPMAKAGMGKVGMGRAIGAAIGDAPLKEFGDKSFMSKVVTGEKVPDYLARIWENDRSRRRFARALLSGDPAVRRHEWFEMPDDD